MFPMAQEQLRLAPRILATRSFPPSMTTGIAGQDRSTASAGFQLRHLASLPNSHSDYSTEQLGREVLVGNHSDFVGTHLHYSLTRLSN